jgi:hypothetical protein
VKRITASHIIKCPVPMETTQAMNVYEDGSIDIICPFLDMKTRMCTKFTDTKCAFSD